MRAADRIRGRFPVPFASSGPIRVGVRAAESHGRDRVEVRHARSTQRGALVRFVDQEKPAAAARIRSGRRRVGFLILIRERWGTGDLTVGGLTVRALRGVGRILGSQRGERTRQPP